jgi:ACS family tartrate transporter-like MFS transporter
MTDKPAEASWLTRGEKEWLHQRMAPPVGTVKPGTGNGFGDALKNPATWLMGITYMLMCTGSYGITLWLPEIIKGSFALKDAWVDAVFAIPYVATGIAMVLIARHSDRSGRRGAYLSSLNLGAALFLALAAFTPNPFIRFAAIGMAELCIWGAQGPFWAIPSTFLSGPAAAGGIGLINTIGNLGGFFGPILMGYMGGAGGGFTPGLWTLSACLFAAWVLSIQISKKTGD